jgi:hypothetical protein
VSEPKPNPLEEALREAHMKRGYPGWHPYMGALAAIRVLMEEHGPWNPSGAPRGWFDCKCRKQPWPCPVLERAAEALRGKEGA